MKTKNGDIISIDYAGYLKEGKVLFDLTDPKLAENKEGKKLDSKIIKLGEGDILPGLDKQLTDKEVGKVYDFEVSHEQAFGKKEPKLIKLYSLTDFQKQKITPEPGMQIDLNGHQAIVRTVGGGRVTLDFNHPLAGKDLLYKVRINKFVTDLKEQVTGMIHLAIPDAEIEVKDKAITVKLKQKVDETLSAIISKNLKERFPELNDTKVITKG